MWIVASFALAAAVVLIAYATIRECRDRKRMGVNAMLAVEPRKTDA